MDLCSGSVIQLTDDIVFCMLLKSFCICSYVGHRDVTFLRLKFKLWYLFSLHIHVVERMIKQINNQRKTVSLSHLVLFNPLR